MEEKQYQVTEKGIVLCEIWKLQTITTTFGILIILLQIFLIAILLLM